MPGSYWIDETRGIVFTRALGVLTDAELLSHGETLGADPRFKPDFRQVVDFRNLTALGITSEAIRSLAQHNPFHRTARRAFVVATDEAFGLVRMFQTFHDADPEHSAIFRSIEPAMEWIKPDSSTPWPAEPPHATFEAP